MPTNHLFIVFLIGLIVYCSYRHRLVTEKFIDTLPDYCVPDPICHIQDEIRERGLICSPDGGLLRLSYIPSPPMHALVQKPKNTPIDQLTCQDYAKRTCLDVIGHDRFESCLSGQYDSCINGRTRDIW